MSKDDNPDPIVVNRWHSTAVKNALDDATKALMSKEHGLVENHALFDGRLALCTLSVIVASIALLWDYLYPHPQSRMVLIVCVVIYFILSGIITLYVLYVERNIFYVGKKMDPTGLDPPDTWQFSSHMEKYDPTYHLSLIVSYGKTKKSKVASLDRCVADFFDAKGTLRPDLYDAAVLKMIKELDSAKKDQ
ncbi:Signal peptidase complex subunit 2 [Clonorchis sinensis]|uniref:Signal peptidase complex subunit 2 n=2 Tax=Clonorchis sinensis TaxID=79923 RepID=B5G4Y6_CLOSI|nr:signal peptidase 25 KDa chain [Clonorchis sinensis]KAG5453017.1 Signal peptidase complex subunit 2 [Clonorchis sinensis]